MTHRHAKALDAAEAALRSISEDAVSKRRSVETNSSSRSAGNNPASLEPAAESSSGQWEYLGCERNVKIYTKALSSSPSPHHQQQQQGNGLSSRSTPDAASRAKAGGTASGSGRVSDSGLPFFRGEGLIEGDWDLSDLLATTASPGARDVWDERFHAGTSHVVAILSERDALLQSSIVSPFPVGPREILVATRLVLDSANRAFYASTSVKDPLAPHGAIARNHVELAGWAFKKYSSDESDALELMEEEDEAEEARAANARRSQHHQRAFSRQFDPLSNALPNLTRQKTLLASTPDKNGRPGMPRRHSNSLAFAPSEAARTQRAASPGLLPKTKGIRTTFVLKTNPGGSLPVTFINSLNVSVPLCIDLLSRYLNTYGFVPHLVSRKGLKLLQEKFDASSGSYNLIFQPLKDSPREVQLRYHGLSFEGRCGIEVKGAAWSLSHDVPETCKTQLPPQVDRPRLRQRFSTSAAVPRLGEGQADDSETDSARLPGNEGGCTLNLVLAEGAGIVQVILTKRAPKDSEHGYNYLVQIGAAMAQARAAAEKEMEDLEDQRFGQLKRMPGSSSCRDSEEGESEIEKAEIMARAMEESFKTVRTAAGLQKPSNSRKRESLQDVRSGTVTPVRWS